MTRTEIFDDILHKTACMCTFEADANITSIIPLFEIINPFCHIYFSLPQTPVNKCIAMKFDLQKLSQHQNLCTLVLTQHYMQHHLVYYFISIFTIK